MPSVEYFPTRPVFTDLPKEKARSGQHGPHGIVDGKIIYCWQTKWEMEKALELYDARQPKKVLELGTAGGGSLYWWLQKAEPGTTIVSVDSYSPNTGYYGEKDNRDQYPKWTPPGVDLVVVEGLTQFVYPQVQPHGPFDWIFIDAGHAYKEVSHDWEIYGKNMVAQGGVVLLQDIYYTPGEVRLLWNQIQREGYLTQELLAAPDVNAFGIGVVYF